MIPLRDNLRCLSFPLVTLILIALNCAAFVIELMVQGSGSAESFFGTYTMVPAEVMKAFASADPHLIGAAVLSMFTAMFLHGGWMHLIGNMLYLFAFGKGIEARLGRVRYVVFYLLCGVLAAVLHIWSDPTSMVPTLGASGAIAGVLGGYLLFWPKADVKGIFMLGIFPIFFTAKAFWFLLFWACMQVFEIVQSIGSVGAGGGVAYWAHVGGFAAGLLLALAWKAYRPNSDVCVIPTVCPCPDEKSEEKSDDEE
jgi:membrane associated rhomboid family serine protease